MSGHADRYGQHAVRECHLGWQTGGEGVAEVDVLEVARFLVESIERDAVVLHLGFDHGIVGAVPDSDDRLGDERLDLAGVAGDREFLLVLRILGTMRSGAIIVNTSRGGVVDDAALAVAIRNGHIAGAALDVFETEPLTATAAEMFADLDNVVLTPHIAGLTTESNERVSDVTVENVKKTLDNH